jgi:hypothetical protein
MKKIYINSFHGKYLIKLNIKEVINKTHKE